MDDGRVAVWRGIRYGRPPIGAGRWRAPEPPEPWEGVADASRFGPASPQSRTPGVPLSPDTVFDEDCLFLNVWRPSGGADRKPVMVWLHGGAYAFGSTAQPIYDASALVTTGDVIVVTVAYRLGALGFLDLRSVASAGEDFDTNLALRDVLLALAWVRDEIAAFGGDPGTVTVFGQSAGAGLVTALLASPAAAGLFHRAISESSPAGSMYGAERSAAVAARFLAAAGVRADDSVTLRRLPVEKIVEAAATVYREVPVASPGTLAFAPVVGDDILPEHPITVLSEGRGLPVPLIIGSNRDEATLFRLMRSPLLPISTPALERMFEAMRQERPDAPVPERDQVLAAYESVRRRALGVGIATDIAFRMPTVWVASGHASVASTHLYRFDFATPLLRLTGVGASHATELPYVWGNLGTLPRDPTYRLGGRRAGEVLSQRMRTRWTGFARTGNPGDDWRPYTATDRATLVIDREDRLVDDLDGPLRAGWGDVVLSFR